MCMTRPDEFLPPVVPCPNWCGEAVHPWEPDGDEWVLAHEGLLPVSHVVGVPVTMMRYDDWHDGAVDVSDPVLTIHATGPVDLDAALLRKLLSLVQQA